VTAEGSFFIQANKEICFSVGQKGNSTLMKAIHLMFESRRAIYHSSKDNTYLVRMGAKKDVQKIVDFFSFDNHHPLIGFKKDSYVI
jgi:hypothetical protein